MKKLFILPLCLLAIVACTDGKKVAEERAQHERDSLMQVIDEKETELNDIMGSINEIQEGFRQINEAEGRITVANGNPEAASSRGVIRENMEFIQQTMQQNRDKIAQLKQRLKTTTVNVEKLTKTIENLQKQLDEQNTRVQELEAQLAEKDVQIAEQGEQISQLNENVSDLKTENQQKAETIQAQDKDLHSAWFVFGTKAELKEQKILQKGDVLKSSDFNKDYFTNQCTAAIQSGFMTERVTAADKCIACGKCEKVCPQHLPIIDLLRDEVSGELWSRNPDAVLAQINAEIE